MASATEAFPATPAQVAGLRNSSLPSLPAGYMSGFGNEFATEALPGALPPGQNSPQVCPYKLYAEQLSGTAFTMPRGSNQRTWLYRIRPSVQHSPFVRATDTAQRLLSSFEGLEPDPNQLRWRPMPLPEGAEEVDFVDGMHTLAGSGDAGNKSGVGIHMYAANKSMGKRAFGNSDGDMLIVPQEGELSITTEMGILGLSPKEICVIPRGIKFSVALRTPTARGYILETYRGHFVLPSLGPIGANGLANPRDFLYPMAVFDAGEDEAHEIVNKFCGRLFTATMICSPFNVVAWHGNYAPFKYDLSLFNTMNSVSFDHPDPSIYTVLTVPSDTPGEAIADFVIFPPRWMVMEKSFRPPYFHRNTMSEFMGMVYGKYDAKEGFLPGGASLHNCMTAHGPDAETFEKASAADLQPAYFDAGLAFMFETSSILKVPQTALDAPWREKDYQECWSSLPRLFTPDER